MKRKAAQKLILIIAAVLVLALLAAGLLVLKKRNQLRATAMFGDFGERVNFTLTASGKTSTVKGYYLSSEHNSYLSIRDLASALSGTEKHFNVQRGSKVQWEINTSRNYVRTTKKENTPFAVVFPGSLSGTNDQQGRDGLLLYRPLISIDGDEQRVFWYYKANGKGEPITDDAFVGVMDIGLLLGIELSFSSDTEISVDTNHDFTLDLDRLEQAEYFQDLNGLVLGNATTGELICTWDAYSQQEIASTSKLMTWLLVQEAIDDGRLTLTSTVKLSENAMRLSASADGKEFCRQSWSVGKEVTIKDLIAGMLLPSSNECALALAEATMLSYGFTDDLEAHFVQRMNDRAYELGLKSARFYNASGLPQYDADQISAKHSNKMAANELFHLGAYIMNHYREQFTAFSAQQTMALPSFGDGIYAESSYYEYLENYAVNGMKSGTTDRAGCCMVASMDIKVNDEVQTVIAVVLGAENNKLRFEQTSALLAYAKQYYR